MAFRKHRAGQIVIEQTRDLGIVRRLLEEAALVTEGVEWPSACYLLAVDGESPVGVVGIEPILDAALVRSLYVTKPYRHRGIGADLVAAARKAAHTRGARRLFAFSTEAGELLERIGFQKVAVKELTAALRGSPETDFYLARPEELAREVAYCLDISRDGIIERG